MIFKRIEHRDRKLHSRWNCSSPQWEIRPEAEADDWRSSGLLPASGGVVKNVNKRKLHKGSRPFNVLQRFRTPILVRILAWGYIISCGLQNFSFLSNRGKQNPAIHFYLGFYKIPAQSMIHINNLEIKRPFFVIM